MTLVKESFILQLPYKQDFINSIKYNKNSDMLAFIHQKHFVSFVDNFSQINNYQNIEKTKDDLIFQTNIYDLAFHSNKILVSNKDMPLRVYNLNIQDPFNRLQCTFYDRKISNQTFLSPIQLAIHDNTIIGGGKKFLSQYDMNKIIAKKHLKLKNTFISGLQIINDTALIGQFTGQISIYDLKSQNIIHRFKPHVDYVTKIKHFNTNHYNFVSLARKDNFVYVWDLRNLSTYIQYFSNQLYRNQRTGLQLSQNDSLLVLGTEQGQTKIYNMQKQSQPIQTLFSKNNLCVSSICRIQDKYINSIGSRQFSYKQQISKGFLGIFTLN